MFDTIVADEATRISNPKTQQSKLIKTIPAKHKIALTGTPLNNAVQDIWSILDFCQPGSLGNYFLFTEKYCLKNRWGAITGYQNLQELKKHLADYMIRRKKIEVMSELPEKLYETIYVDFTKKERKIYNAIKNEIAAELKEYEINKVINEKYLSNILVKMIRLKQTTGSLELISKHQFSSKIEVLKELLDDIMQSNSKAIIFTEFKTIAYILHKELSKYNPLLFTGDTSNSERQSHVKKFNEDNIHKLLIMTAAGGMGLNLQRANFIVHFDMPWSISKIEQREGRVNRIGQKSALTIYKLIVNNSIDEYVWKVLKRKHTLSADILGDKERMRKIRLSKKDISEILK